MNVRMVNVLLFVVVVSLDSLVLLHSIASYRVQPDDIGSHVNVGRTLKQLGNTVDAEEALRKALSLLPPIKKGNISC